MKKGEDPRVIIRALLNVQMQYKGTAEAMDESEMQKELKAAVNGDYVSVLKDTKNDHTMERLEYLNDNTKPNPGALTFNYLTKKIKLYYDTVTTKKKDDRGEVSLLSVGTTEPTTAPQGNTIFEAMSADVGEFATPSAMQQYVD